MTHQPYLSAKQFVVLDREEIAYLEELYVPHNLVGVMSQNGA